jgi:L-aspartate oxidase
MIRRRLTTSIIANVSVYPTVSAALVGTNRFSNWNDRVTYNNRNDNRNVSYYSTSICPNSPSPTTIITSAITSATGYSTILKQPQEQYERLLVIGSGVAGSATALIAAETYKIPVTVLFAGAVPTDCNSNWAQGGIIYRNYNPESNDSSDLLAADIHRAGAGLCYDPAVQKVAIEGPDRVKQLLLDNVRNIFANVPFDRNPNNPNELSLCLEASHGAPRILHKADHSGQTITQHITEAAKRHPLITFQPQTIVTDIVQHDGVCIGVETLQNESIQKTEYASYGTVLATGGLAGIYEHSTNPSGFNALGSSVAIAKRANVHTQDLEYVQFHPTALCIPGQARFLLTEALRGEGAILRDANGIAFAKKYHADGELAPRDIVARAVFAESQKVTSSNDHNVFLDITHRNADWIHQRFPTICQHLQQNSNLDLAYNMLPIIPAAHYTCGGISTDLNGCTNLMNLYAAGEAARTGLHGGNRLASTSLLEGLVFGASVADYIGTTNGYIQSNEASRMIANIQRTSPPSTSSSLSSNNKNLQEDKVTANILLQQLKRVMWDHVGVVRTVSGLNIATSILSNLQQQADELFHYGTKCVDVVALRDATYAGYAVALAAQSNHRSIGAHCIIPEQQQVSSDVESDDEADLLTAMH